MKFSLLFFLLLFFSCPASSQDSLKTKLKQLQPLNDTSVYIFDSIFTRIRVRDTALLSLWDPSVKLQVSFWRSSGRIKSLGHRDGDCLLGNWFYFNRKGQLVAVRIYENCKKIKGVELLKMDDRLRKFLFLDLYEDER